MGRCLQDQGTAGAQAACQALPRGLLVEARQLWRQQAARQACISEFQAELFQVGLVQGSLIRGRHATGGHTQAQLRAAGSGCRGHAYVSVQGQA